MGGFLWVHLVVGSGMQSSNWENLGAGREKLECSSSWFCVGIEVKREPGAAWSSGDQWLYEWGLGRGQGKAGGVIPALP